MTWQKNVSDSSVPVLNTSPQPRNKFRRAILIIVIGLVILLVGLLTFLVLGQKMWPRTVPDLIASTEQALRAGGAGITTPTAPIRATPTFIPTRAAPKATVVPLIYLVWTKGPAAAIYTQSDTDSEVAGYISNGAIVDVLEQKKMDDQTWLHISDGKTEGWLTDDIAYPKSEGNLKYVNWGANVRETPNGSILLALSPGSPVYLTGKMSTDEQNQVWGQVKLLDGREGWMALWLLGAKP